MASLSSAVRTALGRYWSEIYGGAAQGLSTSDLFVNIRQRAADLGLASVGVGANAVSTLRGYAGRMLGAARSLNAANDASVLGAGMIAEAPWSRPLAEQNTLPIYHVGVDVTIQQEDGSVIGKRQTIGITGSLPPTVGDLRSYIQQQAALLAAEGGPPGTGTPRGTLLSVDNLQVLAV